ncbi:hypothetical protein [Clostridium botulinum]|uniref:hypothetical protein n=1 Tax=Clostridium botulinum TaxID=1491 RepID=UPI00077474AF|nr:hypothetical protein [Clostridium botulinum]
MAISKNSRRVQFTLNADKPKEKEMIEFLDGCFNPNVAIKEIIFNHIVSNCEYKLQQVPQSEVLQNHSKSLQVSNLDNNIVSNSNDKLVEVSNGEEKLREVSEIEQNEIEELNKFL